MKTWLVTGAARGLGLEISRAALEAGNRVIAAARDPGRIAPSLSGFGDRLLALPLDVTDPAQAEAAVAAGRERFGGIDILVNNAGYGQFGCFEDVSARLIQRQFETNLCGTMHVTRAVLPTMRDQQSGHIFTISSMAGIVGIAGASIYSASKFALEGWMECLRIEVAPFGIAVTLVEPGLFRTDFLDPSSISHSDLAVGAYEEESAKKRAYLAALNHNQIGVPARLGAAMLKLVEADDPPLRFSAGTDVLPRIQEKIEMLRRDSEAWHALTISTDA